MQAWHTVLTQAAPASPQSVAVLHSTHASVVGSQTSGLPQPASVLGRQPTWQVALLQMSPARHWLSAVQVVWHWSATQAPPSSAWQSAAVWQSPNSHTPPTQMKPVPHSESSLGGTQAVQLLDLQTS